MEIDSRSRSELNLTTSSSLVEDLPKYIIHGFLFAFIQLGFALGWEFLLMALLFSGSFTTFLGFILVLLVVMVSIFGAVNGALARQLWGLNPNNTITSFLGQGLLILIMFPIFSPMYYIIILLTLPYSLVTSGVFVIFLLVVDSIFLGYLGKIIAAEFEGREEGREELASVSSRHKKCPHCGSYFAYDSSYITADGIVTCPHCGREHIVPVPGPDLGSSFGDW